MKKLTAIVLCLVAVFGCMGVNAFAEAEAITPRYDNAVNTNSSFTIFENGTAIVSIGYDGYVSETPSVRITTTLQKRSLLVFWNDVTEWVDVSTKSSDNFAYSYSVGDGTYRVKIRFEFSGVSGETDVIEREHKASH